MRPIICTACGHPFRTFRDWLEHRAVIKSWEMPRHQGHTRRCLSPRQWALMVLAECQGIQEIETQQTVKELQKAGK